MPAGLLAHGSNASDPPSRQCRTWPISGSLVEAYRLQLRGQPWIWAINARTTFPFHPVLQDWKPARPVSEQNSWPRVKRGLTRSKAREHEKSGSCSKTPRQRSAFGYLQKKARKTERDDDER